MVKDNAKPLSIGSSLQSRQHQRIRTRLLSAAAPAEQTVLDPREVPPRGPPTKPFGRSTRWLGDGQAGGALAVLGDAVPMDFLPPEGVTERLQFPATRGLEGDPERWWPHMRPRESPRCQELTSDSGGDEGRERSKVSAGRFSFPGPWWQAAALPSKSRSTLASPTPWQFQCLSAKQTPPSQSLCSCRGAGGELTPMGSSRTGTPLSHRGTDRVSPAPPPPTVSIQPKTSDCQGKAFAQNGHSAGRKADHQHFEEGGAGPVCVECKVSWSTGLDVEKHQVPNHWSKIGEIFSQPPPFASILAAAASSVCQTETWRVGLGVFFGQGEARWQEKKPEVFLIFFWGVVYFYLFFFKSFWIQSRGRSMVDSSRASSTATLENLWEKKERAWQKRGQVPGRKTIQNEVVVTRWRRIRFRDQLVVGTGEPTAMLDLRLVELS
ncbi:hypothetical protein E2320_022515 [Naja naja]|nr:hypothetical protein E2320_022515 [Naja naja]